MPRLEKPSQNMIDFQKYYDNPPDFSKHLKNTKTITRSEYEWSKIVEKRRIHPTYAIYPKPSPNQYDNLDENVQTRINPFIRMYLIAHPDEFQINLPPKSKPSFTLKSEKRSFIVKYTKDSIKIVANEKRKILMFSYNENLDEKKTHELNKFVSVKGKTVFVEVKEYEKVPNLLIAFKMISPNEMEEFHDIKWLKEKKILELLSENKSNYSNKNTLDSIISCKKTMKNAEKYHKDLLEKHFRKNERGRKARVSFLPDTLHEDFRLPTKNWLIESISDVNWNEESDYSSSSDEEETLTQAAVIDNAVEARVRIPPHKRPRIENPIETNQNKEPESDQNVIENPIETNQNKQSESDQNLSLIVPDDDIPTQRSEEIEQVNQQLNQTHLDDDDENSEEYSEDDDQCQLDIDLPDTSYVKELKSYYSLSVAEKLKIKIPEPKPKLTAKAIYEKSGKPFSKASKKSSEKCRSKAREDQERVDAEYKLYYDVQLNQCRQFIRLSADEKRQYDINIVDENLGATDETLVLLNLLKNYGLAAEDLEKIDDETEDECIKRVMIKSKQKIGKKYLQPKIFKCQFCDFETKTEYNFNRHIDRKHSNKSEARQLISETGTAWKCPSCNMEFYSAEDAKKHTSRCANTKAFTCKKCDYKCQTDNQLRYHMLTHKNKKEMKKWETKCTCPRCKKVFKSVSNMRAHYNKNICDPDTSQSGSNSNTTSIDSNILG